MFEDLPCPHRAVQHLRGNREGTLLADGLATPVKFVCDSASGRIVFPTTPSTLSSSELVLFVPQEEPPDVDELQLLVAPREIDPSHDEPCDRWRAYHGEPRLSHWAACEIESARFAGEVIDETPLGQPNPLAPVEPRLCRRLNSDLDALGRLCTLAVGCAPHDPLAVGVDPGGIDVRARFGIMRIPFKKEAWTPDAAAEMIESLLQGQNV
jgi:hypothetical protein